MALFGKTTDGILASFTKTVTDLRAVQAREQADAKRSREQAELLEIAASEHSDEAQRAQSIADRIENLIG